MDRLKEWWSRRVRWQKIVLVIVGVSVVAAPFSDSGDEGSDSDDIAPIAATTSTTQGLTTSAVTTSTTAPDPTTTDTATTSTAPPTTAAVTVFDGVVEDVRVLLSELAVVDRFAPETPYELNHRFRPKPPGQKTGIIAFTRQRSLVPALSLLKRGLVSRIMKCGDDPGGWTMGTTRSIRSVEIHAPVESVFAFVADPASMLALLGSEPGEVETATDGSVTRYEWTARFPLLPRDVHGVSTRLEHAANRRIVESASTGPVTTWEVETVGEFTRLTMTEQISTRLPLVNKIIELIGTRGKGLAHKQDQILEEIKDRVEG